MTPRRPRTNRANVRSQKTVATPRGERRSHPRTAARECCKGDDENLWRTGKYDPPPPKNPVTDRNQNLYGILCKILCGSDKRFRFCACAITRTPCLSCFIAFFPITYSQDACTNFDAKQNVKVRGSAQECAFCGTRTHNLTFRTAFSPKTVTFWAPFRRDKFFSPANGISIGQLKSQRPLIVVLVPKSCIVNRQIGFGYSKNVIVPDLLLTAHVIQRMRSVRVRIFKGNQWGTL